MTGSRSVLDTAGVHTLSVRQSSLDGIDVGGEEPRPRGANLAG